MELFGLQINGDHLSRLLVPAIGGALAFLGFAAGRWTRHRARVNFKHEDLVSSSVIVEMYGITVQADGSDMLDIITQGSALTIEQFFLNADLIRNAKRAAAKHPGLLRLPGAVAHRMMMDQGKDVLTGLDARANMDFVHGRPTQDDETLFGFASYAEHNHNGGKLHDQIGRLVLMVVSPALIERLSDPEYIKRLRVRHAGYRPRCARLHDFALEWQGLQKLPAAERSAASDGIWLITVRTSRLAAQETRSPDIALTAPVAPALAPVAVIENE